MMKMNSYSPTLCYLHSVIESTKKLSEKLLQLKKIFIILYQVQLLQKIISKCVFLPETYCRQNHIKL